MPDIPTLMALITHFAGLSLMAVGGGAAVLPEMESAVADLGISSTEFAQIYSLGQLAPGPNMTMVVVLGDRIAGGWGALAALLAFFVPASVLVLFASRLWDRIGESPWRRAVQNALAPISIGLMASGVWAIASNAITGPVTILIAAAVTAVMLLTKLNPALLVLAGAVVGLALLQS